MSLARPQTPSPRSLTAAGLWGARVSRAKQPNETMKKKTLNYTPHEIVIVGENGEVIIRLPSDGVARVAASSESAGEWDGLPLTRSSFGEVEGLPEEKDGTRLIVSRVVAAAASGRSDLLVPGQLVRDATGQPIGCRSLEVV